jgi:hypothetical protein
MTECCDAMTREMSRHCDTHGDDQFACPDRVIHKTAAGGYGLIIHDGGSSFYRITFCPWCGTSLSEGE